MIKNLKLLLNFIFEILKWSLISIIELFINLCTVLAILVWTLYILNLTYLVANEIFNYYIPSYTKTCYLLFNLEYCNNNNIN